MDENLSVVSSEGSEVATYEAAIKLHNEIMANGAIAANALYDMCAGLKRMRDSKLYLQLGYTDFDTYCEDKANIKSRQAHNYIRTVESLGKSFLQSNANIGITKLELLTHIPAPDRADFAEDNDLTAISVADLQKKIEDLQRDNGQKAEQLSLLSEQVTAAKSDKQIIADKQAEIDRLSKELAAKPIEVAVAEPDPNVIAMMEADKQKAIKDAVAAERKKAEQTKQELEQEQKLHSDLIKRQLEDATKRAQDLKQQLEDAQAKAQTMEQRIAAVKDDGAAKFKIYFTQVNDMVGKMAEALDEIKDKAVLSKYRRKMSDLADMIQDASGWLENEDI